jgi:hypothetical protein
MPKATNRIDFTTISDVIIQLRYTALDGGGGFRTAVVQSPKVKYYSGFRFLSLRQECLASWQRTANASQGAGDFTLDPIVVSADMFPVNLMQNDGKPACWGLGNVVPGSDPLATDNQILLVAIPKPGSKPGAPQLRVNNCDAQMGKVTAPALGAAWTVHGNAALNDLSDIVLILPYTTELDWAL